MSRLYLTLIATLGAAFAEPASAQDEPTETASPEVQESELADDAETPESARIRELEARLSALEARLAQPGASIAGTAAPPEGAFVQASASARQPAPFTLGGWVEAYYGWNFNQPSNGITNLRGFDNRHDSFNLSNAVVDSQWDWEGVNGRITLQWGSTPATYYLAETFAPSLGSAVGPQSQMLWQWLQQAYVGYRIPVGGGLNIQAGLFLSPVGAEAMAVKDNWFYSRTNLFFGYPFYHTGVRVNYQVNPELSVGAWLINGWNTVLDNNEEKSFIAQASWVTANLVTINLNYVSGVERPTGAPEGRAWRHTFDLNATVTPLPWLGLQGQATGGFEPNDFGTSAYMAGMLAVRLQIVDWLAFSARGDFFWEHVPSNAMGTASAIFWPTEWVSSGTATLTIQPHEHVRLLVEYRHDQAPGNAYFQGSVVGNGDTIPFVVNASSQNTFTVGTTAWF